MNSDNQSHSKEQSSLVSDLTGVCEADTFSGSLWEHVRTQGVYRFLFRALRVEDQVEIVVYRSTETGKVWTRLASQFFDGRFKKLG